MNEWMIIGIDGGASKVNGWLIERDEKTGRFSLGQKQVYREYREHPDFDQGFQPLPITDQLDEAAIGPREERQSRVWIETCASVITELVRASSRPVIVGIGMPGLKTSDGRGIRALANGPRNPWFTERLEERLRDAKIRLSLPIARLGSDADYCGMGEELGVSGSFTGSMNALYLGGGTGVADALKLNGHLVPFDSIKNWMAKSWELKTSDGLSAERYISAKGIQACYARYSQVSMEELDDAGIYGHQILSRAVEGENAAGECLEKVTEELAMLLFERLTTLYSGWRAYYDFVNPAREQLLSTHSHQGTLLDRIVIGQRLGDLLNESKKTEWLWKPLLQKLGSRVLAETDVLFVDHYCRDGQFRPEIIHLSTLRDAPALGAGIDAFQTCSISLKAAT